jgi:enamine deaminase RidA (YjgF/YER057c/UK114 family)
MARVTITVESADLGNVTVISGDIGLMPDAVRDVQTQLDDAIAKVRRAYQIRSKS